MQALIFLQATGGGRKEGREGSVGWDKGEQSFVNVQRTWCYPALPTWGITSVRWAWLDCDGGLGSSRDDRNAGTGGKGMQCSFPASDRAIYCDIGRIEGPRLRKPGNVEFGGLLISQAVQEVNKQQQMGIQVYMTVSKTSFSWHNWL